MKIIVEGRSDIRRVLGHQRLRDTSYRRMKYLLWDRYDEGVLLHNTITGELIQLDINEARTFEDIPLKPDDTVAKLIDGYYLVPNDFNEHALVLNLRKVFKKMNDQDGINGYMILPTTECNARCAYCFEQGNARLTMTAPTADQVVDYIASHKGNGHVELHWFGGEPLIGMQRIDQICTKLRKQSISFVSIMTSNGYLFDEHVAKRSVTDWNLKKVQITLDGTEEQYNRIKAYVAPQGSPFRRVLRNVHSLAENGIHVTLRLNVDEHNYNDISELCDRLCMEFESCELVNMYASMVLKETYDGPTDDLHMNMRILYERVSSINDRIQSISKAAHSNKLLSLKFHACMADDSRAIIIHPNGSTSVCQHVRDRNIIGHIRSDEVDKKKLDFFRKELKLDRCSECPIYPGCLELEACPSTSVFDWYVCENTVRREKARISRYITKLQSCQEDSVISLSGIDIRDVSC